MEKMDEESATVTCHTCGQVVPRRGLHSTLAVASPGGDVAVRTEWYCKDCWAQQQRQEHADDAEHQRGLEATAVRALIAADRALTVPGLPVRAAPVQIDTAIRNQEAWARAHYALLRAKYQRSLDAEYGDPD